MQKFEAFNRQKTCRYGQMLYNVNDTRVGRSLDLYGEFCDSEVEVFRQVLQPGNVVIEVGAGIGAHTLFLAQQVTKAGVVIAFEPQRVQFQTLCANLALNSISNVFCLQQAIGARTEGIKIPPLDYTRENDFGALSLGGYPVGEQVPCSPLDGFNFGACHFLRIDVEGMEQEVLEGASKCIGRFKPVIYLDNSREDKSAALIRYLDSLSYKMYWHRAPYYNPNNFFGNRENIFGDFTATNMVCIHGSRPHNLQGCEPVEVEGRQK